MIVKKEVEGKSSIEIIAEVFDESGGKLEDYLYVLNLQYDHLSIYFDIKDGFIIHESSGYQKEIINELYRDYSYGFTKMDRIVKLDHNLNVEYETLNEVHYLRIVETEEGLFGFTNLPNDFLPNNHKGNAKIIEFNQNSFDVTTIGVNDIYLYEEDNTQIKIKQMMIKSFLYMASITVICLSVFYYKKLKSNHDGKKLL